MLKYSASECIPVGVIIPVYNEEHGLREVVESILSFFDVNSELIVVFNGCTDRSRSSIEHIADPRIQRLHLEVANKALAIRLAEKQALIFPRFYVDADVKVSGHDLFRLAKKLETGKHELVAGRLVLDLSGATALSRAANSIWSYSPHVRNNAFQQVIGVTRGGRARWGEMPDVIADDTFIASRIPEDRKRVAYDVRVIVCPPLTFWAFVGVRTRIANGVKQLKYLGVRAPRRKGQIRFLLSAFLMPTTSLSACVYAFAILIGRIRSAFTPIELHIGIAT